jgi:hypothetical protein
MKYGMIMALGLCIAANFAVNAASISVEKNPANDAYSLFLNGGEHNDAFDTIFVLMKPNAPAVFTNILFNLPGVPRPPGHPFTYANDMVVADPGDIEGGLGLSRFGLIRVANEVSFTAVSLGGTITTASQPGGNLFLANVNMPGNSSSGLATVQILRQGALVQEMNAVFSIPEPPAFALAASTLFALSFIRRRAQRR